MSDEIGKLKVTLGLDSANFEKSVASTQRNIKGLGQELSILRGKGKEWGESTEGLKTRQETLGRTLTTQESLVQKLRAAYDKSVEEKGKDAKATEDLANKLNKAVAEYTRTETELSQVNDTLAKQESDLKNAEEGWAKFTQTTERSVASIDDLKARQESLGDSLEKQKDNVINLGDAYEKSVEEKGKDAKATQELAEQLNKALNDYKRTESEIEQVNQALSDQETSLQNGGRDWRKFADKANEASETIINAGDKIQDVGDKVSSAGEKMSLGITAPLTAAGVFSAKTALDFDVSQGKIQAALGVTQEEAEALQSKAESLWKNGFGGNIGEASAAIINVSQVMKDSPTDELESAAEAAFTIADAFDKDVNEVTRSANQLMKDFGLTSEQSFDLITAGFQSGLDFSDEFLDTINEYSPQFKAVGFTAEDFFDKLLAGAEAGAFNLDKVGDAVKEFNIRAKDGSEATTEAFEALNLDAEKMTQTFAKGGEEGAEAFQMVLDELMKIEDPVKRNEVAVSLFGTQFEDLEENAINALRTTTGEFKDVEGATKNAGDALYDNFGTRVQMQFRDFVASLEPAGEILLEIGEKWLPKISDAAEDALGWFNGLSEEGQETAISLAAMSAAAGPTLVALGGLSTGIGGVVKVGGGLVGLLGKAGGSGLIGRIGLMSASAGPVGLAVGGLAALTVGVVALSDSTKDYIDINYEKIDALKAEVEATDSLIEDYEGLADKNKLTTEEMLRYLDVLYEIGEAKTEESVALLKEEQGKLLEKSSLTNEEMERFLDLNEQVIQQAPNTIQAVSEEGFAYADNLEALKQLNAEKERELVLTTSRELETALAAETELLKEQAALKSEINEIDEKINTSRQEIADNLAGQCETEEAIRGVKEELLALEGESTIEAQAQKAILEAELNDLNTKLLGLEEEEEALSNNRDRLTESLIKKNEGLESTREELRELDRLKNDYEALILSQAGLTSEKGEGLTVLSQQKDELLRQKDELTKLHSQGKLNTSEYQEQVGKISEQIGKIEAAQGELELMNEIAGETVYKDINISTSPSIDKLNAELTAEGTKHINVDYSVRKSAGLAPYAAAYATGTRSAIGGMSLVGEEGPELVHLPRGSRVIPAGDTASIFQKWNVPTETSSISSIKTSSIAPIQSQSTDSLSGAVAQLSAKVDALATKQSHFTINPANVVIDGKQIAEVTFEANQTMLANASRNQNYMKGMRL